MEPEWNDRDVIAAAALAAHDKVFGFMLIVLKQALRIEGTNGATGDLFRAWLPRFRGEHLTPGLPEHDGMRFSAAEERLANEHYRMHMNKLTAELSAVLDEFGG